MEEIYNKFNANIVRNYNVYEKLSDEYNIPISEIIQIDLNRSGIYLPNNEVKINFRVRFKAKMDNDYETWYALPVREKIDTNFSAHDDGIYFKDKKIGRLNGELILDTCENSYQRGKYLLNLNSRSRSNCGGCKACIHNYKNFYDSTVIKDRQGLYTMEEIEAYFDSKDIDVSKLIQIAVVTGLFKSEENVVEHMKLVYESAKKRGFQGNLMYFGCEVNSNAALEELSKIPDFSLIYAFDNFSKRDKLLTKSKSMITIEEAKKTLDNAKSKGISTTISYIAGLDSLASLYNGFTLLRDSFTNFPVINIYQIQNASQSKIMDSYASELKYYLDSRIGIEKIFLDKNYKPKRWENYRPLWYKYYANDVLLDNSFGQQEKIKRIKRR